VRSGAAVGQRSTDGRDRRPIDPTRACVQISHICPGRLSFRLSEDRNDRSWDRFTV
jgi:hypothetical protein